MHTAVLRDQAIAALCIDPQGFYIDATFGRGGHAGTVLERLHGDGRLLVLDRDPQAIEVAKEMAKTQPRLLASQLAFSQLAAPVRHHEAVGKVHGILFDLGVSSPQLDDPDRGFSFMRDGPLDMRMDNGSGISAGRWLHSAPESEISDVLRRYGQEKFARPIAAAIVQERRRARIASTGRLAQIVKQAHPAWEKARHPATRVFQAIRIQVNGELDELEKGLVQAVKVLAPGGRLVVISFHSLEHRIVKRFIDRQVKGDQFPKRLPITADRLIPGLRKIGKPIRPDRIEVELNPRARSAVMRVAEKIN